MARVLGTHRVSSHLRKTLLIRQLRECGQVVQVAVVGSRVEDCIPGLRRGVGLEGASMCVCVCVCVGCVRWVGVGGWSSPGRSRHVTYKVI